MDDAALKELKAALEAGTPTPPLSPGMRPVDFDLGPNIWVEPGPDGDPVLMSRVTAKEVAFWRSLSPRRRRRASRNREVDDA